MAFAPTTNQVVERNPDDYKLYTGLTEVKVVGINPTKEESAKLGYFYNKEISYNVTDPETGIKKTRIDIYVEGKPDNAVGVVKGKIVWFIGEKNISSTGKYQYIDTYGKTSWKNSDGVFSGNPSFKVEESRLALDNEEHLINFLRCYLNCNKDTRSSIDNPNDLLNGDITEIKNAINMMSGTVLVLCGVREADKDVFYQDIYPKQFGYGWVLKSKTGPSYMIDQINKIEKTKSYYGVSPYTFQLFNKDQANIEAISGVEQHISDLPF